MNDTSTLWRSFYQKHPSFIALILSTLFISGCGGGGGGGSKTAIEPSTEATLTTIELRSDSSTIAKGTSSQLSATGIYTDASTQDLTSQVTWSVSDSAILTVDENGQASGQTSGSVVITASFASIENTINLSVSPATLTSLTLSPLNVTIASGTSSQLSASGRFSDGSIQDLTSQSTWQSSNQAIVSVSALGMLEGLSQGSSTITATNGSTTGSVTITVSPATLSQIEVNLDKSEIALGTGVQAYATGIFSDNTTQDLTNQVTWVSSNTTVATILSQTADSGWVESQQVGLTQLSASYSGLTGSTAFEVKGAALTSIEVTPTNLSVAAGLTENYHAVGHYSDSSIQDITSQVVWQSSNTTVASIDNSTNYHGVMSANNTGTSTISATFGTISGTTQLTITPAVLRSIALNIDNSSVAAGLKLQFAAAGHYSDGATVDLTTQAQWLSSDTSIASGDPSGSGLFTSHTAGSTIVTASVNGVLGFHHLTVTTATLISIVVDQVTPTIALGTQQTFTATGHYSDTSTQNITNSVTWQSSDNSIATISNSEQWHGNANGFAQGVVTITAYLDGQNGSTVLTVSPATIFSITLSGDTTDLINTTSTQLQATAHFSDSSTQDFTQFVTWSSSTEDIATVSNIENKRGLVTGVDVGSVQLSANYNGLEANPPYQLSIVNDPNAPISLALSVEPNVILNNGSDSSTLNVTLQPAGAAGIIADNTVVEFEITEGGSVSTVTSTTLDGAASTPYSSTYTGTILVKASVQTTSISSISTLYSAVNFAEMLRKGADILPIYDAGTETYLTGSLFGLYMQNYSNRDFDLVGYQINNGGSAFYQTVDPAYLSDGQLTAGEVTGLIYSLDIDRVDYGITTSYFLQDPSTSKIFGFTVSYMVN